MPEYIIVVALEQDMGIGQKGVMPWHYPEDLCYFKNLTRGYPVLMGHQTYLSIGGSLSGRRNFVLSKKVSQIPDCEVISSLESPVLAAIRGKIFVIGGASVYAQLMPKCRQMYITHINKSYSCDCHFIDIDPGQWQIDSAVPGNNKELLFCHYIRSKS